MPTPTLTPALTPTLTRNANAIADSRLLEPRGARGGPFRVLLCAEERLQAAGLQLPPHHPPQPQHVLAGTWYV